MDPKAANLRRLERTRQEMIQLCHNGLDARTLWLELRQQLRKVIPIDVSFFATADPATLMFTGAMADEILAQATPEFLTNEFLQEDVNKFTGLARSPFPTGSLIQATRNDLTQSARYRDILEPLALGDELRAALLTGGNCWGFLCLHRERSSGPFRADEAAFLERIAPHIAEGLRKALLLGSIQVTDPAGEPGFDEPGLLLLAENLSVVATTPAAERWLAVLTETDGQQGTHLPGGLPYAVVSVVARLKAMERAEERLPKQMPKVRLRTASGHWLVLHASRITGAQNQIAVIFEVARPVEIAPLIVLAYDLTRREGEIMQSVLRGLSTAEIAEDFHISTNTVQDHLKMIFEKVGVRSRRELVGHIFTEHYQTRMSEGHHLNTGGWFGYG